MERLTKLNRKQDMMKLMDSPMSRGHAECWLRLYALEDILGDDYDLDRLRELVEAGRGGRCGDIKNRCAIKVGNNKYNEIIVTGESQEVLAIISDTVVVVKNGIAVAFKD